MDAPRRHWRCSKFRCQSDDPQVVDERLVYMTPPWKDAFRFAVETADALGLEFAIAASPAGRKPAARGLSPMTA